MSNTHQTYYGGCHCGRVKFAIEAVQAPLKVYQCNCSICRRSGFLHLIVPKTSFKLLSGQEALVEYSFGTKTAKHFFCRHCGVKSFYIPRSNPNGYSIHAGCLDPQPELNILPFDGAGDWEGQSKKVSHLA